MAHDSYQYSRRTCRLETVNGFHVKQIPAYVRTYQRAPAAVELVGAPAVREPAILMRANSGSLAKRQYPPARLRNEGERLNDWRVWNLRGNGHPDGHLELAGEHTC